MLKKFARVIMSCIRTYLSRGDNWLEIMEKSGFNYANLYCGFCSSYSVLQGVHKCLFIKWTMTQLSKRFCCNIQKYHKCFTGCLPNENISKRFKNSDGFLVSKRPGLSLIIAREQSNPHGQSLNHRLRKKLNKNKVSSMKARDNGKFARLCSAIKMSELSGESFDTRRPKLHHPIAASNLTEHLDKFSQK